jgi:hypothetical protein
MSEMLQRLQDTDPRLVQNFLKTHKSTALSSDLREYITRINAVPAIIHNLGNSLTKTIKILQRQFPDMTYSQARSLYYDAMNFFYLDDDISVGAWDNYYAELFDKMSALAISMNKIDSAARCASKAHDLRTLAKNRIKPQEWKVPSFLININVRPEDLNYASKSIYNIIKKDEDGQYSKLIDGLPTTEAEKKRLRADAGIQDITPEEVQDEK